MDEHKMLDEVVKLFTEDESGDYVELPLDRYNELLQKEAYIDLALSAQKSMADYQIKEMLAAMAAVLWGVGKC